MMTMYSKVCRIYTPYHSVHLRYRCIFVHPVLLLDDVLEGHERGCLGMHLRTEIEWDQRCTWRARSSKCGDALADTVIKWTQRCTWMPWLNKIGGVAGGSWSGCDGSEGGQSGGSHSGGGESGGSESGGSWSGSMCDGSWESIHWLTRNCWNVENWVTTRSAESWETNWEQETVDRGMMHYAVYAVPGVLSAQCILYSEYAVFGIR